MKRFVLMSTLAAVITFHVPDLYSAELTSEQKIYLKEKGTVIFVSQTHYPPFEFVGPDGDHTGMCIELIRWISTEFGFKVLFTDTTFKQAQDDLLSGKADVLTSFFYSEKREQLFDFSPTLFEVPASIFVDSHRPDIKDMSDLQGKIVAMQAGDYAKEFLESKKIRCDLKYTRNFAEATDLVASGQADAIIGDEQIVLYHIFSNHLTEKIKKVGAPLYIGKNCMGFREPGGQLLDIMNAGISMARRNGVLDQINRKWLGTTYSGESKLVQKLIPFFVFLLSSVVLISMAVWAWNLKLRQKVASRTSELARSEQTLRTILEASPLGIGLAEGLTIKWYNPAISKMLGCDSLELIGASVEKLYPDEEHEGLKEQLLKKLESESSERFVETRWVRKDGSLFDCRLRLVTMDLNGRNVTISIAEDITELKQVENRMKASLKEKDMLLREIHHRVKNNMQVISSLLSLQEDKINRENIFQAFKDSQNRIQSIALVHEILYQSDDFSEIHVRKYLDALIGYIQPIYAPADGSVNIGEEIAEISLKLDHAVPFGIMITELLTNAIKYGMVDGEKLEIKVTVEKVADDVIRVKVSDNGPGIRADFDPDKSETLGLKLVKGVVEDQLEGHFYLADTRGYGTCWVVEWPSVS